MALKAGIRTDEKSNENNKQFKSCHNCTQILYLFAVICLQLHYYYVKSVKTS